MCDKATGELLGSTVYTVPEKAQTQHNHQQDCPCLQNPAPHKADVESSKTRTDIYTGCKKTEPTHYLAQTF